MELRQLVCDWANVACSLVVSCLLPLGHCVHPPSPLSASTRTSAPATPRRRAESSAADEPVCGRRVANRGALHRGAGHRRRLERGTPSVYLHGFGIFVS